MQVMFAQHRSQINVMPSGQDLQLLARGFGPIILKKVKGVSKWDM
jgi:hypothetical protein